MNIADDARQLGLRTRLRDWLHVNRPDALPADDDQRQAALRAWQRALWEAGWMGLSWPREFGGHGGEPVDQVIFNQELAAAHAPSPPGIIGLQTLGPTLMHHGTAAQRLRFLPPILDAREIWCQGFSEPGAGSDLAALRTSAVRDGDDYIVNGQKVWTSYARHSDWCALLVRTGAPDSKHRGISYVLVDMRTPGIEVRPIHQINGGSTFNEVFFEDVRVPVANLVGEENGGWAVAMSTLAHERSNYVLSRSVELTVAFEELVEQLDDTQLTDEVVLRIGECQELLLVLEAQSFSTLTHLMHGGSTDVSAIEKLLTSEIEQTLFSCALDTLGAHRNGVPGAIGSTVDAGRWLHDYLESRSATIHGGTAEILRNTIAQRLLGLPRER
jgi:alkylation response protein AidB-like acyl-CoA dehydrogenase